MSLWLLARGNVLFGDWGRLPQPTACTVPAWLQAPAEQGARQGAVRLPPRDRLPQGEPGQQVAQGRRGDDHPPLQHLHLHHGDQAQALPGQHASRHPPLQRQHRRQPCGPELAPRRHVPGVHQPGCPGLPAGPRGARSSQRRPHQRKACGGAHTRQVRPHLRGNGVYLVTFRARNDGRSRCLHRGGVLTLQKAFARLGSAGGRAAGQAQEGHLVRATPGHDRPSDYGPRCWPARLLRAAHAPCSVGGREAQGNRD